MEKDALYWEETFEIVLALQAYYGAVDLEKVGLSDVYRMVVALPNFADDPSFCNDGILADILREWYEESDS